MKPSAAFRSALVLGVLLSASPAFAQGETERAEALFEEGRRALARGDYDAACKRFSESNDLDPGGGTLLNLGECEERRGQFAAAWNAFRDAQRLLGATDGRATYALKRAAALEPRVARITIATDANATVTRDGEALRAKDLGAAIAMMPGSHVLAARAPDGRGARVEVTLQAGESRTIDLSLPTVLDKSAAKSPPPDPPTPSTRTTVAKAPGETSSSNAGAIAAFAVGTVGVLTGVMTGIMVLDAKSTYRSHCNPYCDDEGRSAAERGRTFGVVSPLAFVVGAAGLALGTYLVITPTASKHGMGVTWQGRF